MKLKYNLINIKELLNGSISVHVIFETTDLGSEIDSEDVNPGLNIIYLTGSQNQFRYSINSLGEVNDGVQLIVIPQYDNLHYTNKAQDDDIQNFDNFKVYTFKYVEPKGDTAWVKTGEFHSEDGQIINSYDYTEHSR